MTDSPIKSSFFYSEKLSLLKTCLFNSDRNKVKEIPRCEFRSKINVKSLYNQTCIVIYTGRIISIVDYSFLDETLSMSEVHKYLNLFPHAIKTAV